VTRAMLATSASNGKGTLVTHGSARQRLPHKSGRCFRICSSQRTPRIGRIANAPNTAMTAAKTNSAG
jgi:hypothetical protein